MKKSPKYNSVITSALLLILLVSCSNFLEQEPGKQISINEQMATKNGVLMALTGTYSSLEELMRIEAFATYGDLQGGNLSFTPVATGSLKGQVSVPYLVENVYNFQDDPRSSNFESFYDAAYDVINQANLILTYVADLNDASESEISEISAEAYAIRGFTHFLLSQIYAKDYSAGGDNPGIVYMDSSLDNNLSYPSRSSLSETMTLIIEDMNMALSSFESAQALDGPEYSYFNTANVQALLARIYLAAGQYDNAIETAESVITNSGYSLTSGENYIAQWESYSTPLSETLFELTPPRDQNGSIGGSLQSFFGYTSSTTFGDYIASADLLDIFEENDIRGNGMFFSTELDTDINGTLTPVSYAFTKKFQGEPGIPVIRLSEMYLIMAEALQQSGEDQEALNYVNVIRERANIEAITSTEDLENTILLERRREFCFEGALFFDLKRLQKDIVRNDCIATTCDLVYYSNYYVLPIPQKNINLNENLEQNEGY
ncbi:RagB/SusD family nutrient uptake outer membrane protein [Robertkochia solimangrovi]|uniref:RagB/SusD family nutrient uptake outer membrane protein n=1 Tax=Robertkochia solimangrovi TaxID=2213046 RepID=UPI0011816FDC|nr:RagB/SusD family nutrient uptake outer membrane protein [Robertkochia solimangrovi]TRZ43197.1 RagB/SusD family nutrient uptake outer membrane protein [Robertkochia solimangrovi]